MNPNYKIFLRSDYPKKDGSISVYLRVIINRKKKDYALGISIFEPEKFWDPKTRHIKRCSWVNQNYVNGVIEDAEIRTGDIFRDIKKTNHPLTLDEFDRRFKNPIEIKDSFYAYAEKEIEHLRKMNASSETIRSYKSYITKLKKYRANLTFGEITRDLVVKYHEYMIGLGNGVNTCHKSLAFCRMIIKRATRDKIVIMENPFENYKLTRQPGKRDYLTTEEIERLEDLYHSGTLTKGLENALRCFLFVCYNGLRYRDAKKLKHSDIKKESHNGTEKSMIRITQHKTDQPVCIPVINKAEKLIKEGFQEQAVMKMPSNQVINRHLKTIAKQAKIDKRLTFHVGRHSFAVAGISLGIPIEVVSKLLGHTDLKTTQIYTKIIEDIKVRYMERFDTLL